MYARFNNKRKKSFQLFTTLVQDGEDVFFAKKAVVPEAEPFLARLLESCTKLQSASRLKPVSCRRKDDAVIFATAPGVSFDELLLSDLTAGKRDAFRKHVEQFHDLLFGEKTEMQNLTQECINYFNIEEGFAEKEWQCIAPGALDLLPENIFFDNGTYTLIDYEWVCDFPVPIEFIFWRSLATFYVRHQTHLSPETFVPLDVLCDQYDIDREKRKHFALWEYSFQKRVQKNVLESKDSFVRIFDMLNNSVDAKRNMYLPSTQKMHLLERELDNPLMYLAKRLVRLIKKRL